MSLVLRGGVTGWEGGFDDEPTLGWMEAETGSDDCCPVELE